MTSLRTRLLKALIRLYTYPYRKRHMSLSRSIVAKNKAYKPPKGIIHALTRFGGVGTEIFIANRDGIPIVMFHGGGEKQGINGMYRKAAERLARLSDGSVYAIDYKTGADLKYPALHDECRAAYTEIAKTLSVPPLAVGDSMGANIMLSICLRLRDNGFHMPKALICVSPFVDLAATGISYEKNCRSDPMYALPKSQSYEKYGKYLRRVPVYCGDTDPKDPYLSPAYASFAGFPPMLVQCGDCETSESDSDMLYRAAERDGVFVRLTKYKGMFHDFQLLFPSLKESRAAWREITEFIENYK